MSVKTNVFHLSGRSAVRLAHWFWEPGVGGSNPLAPTRFFISGNYQIWAFSSVGRAPALQAGCRGFKSLNAHHNFSRCLQRLFFIAS